MREARVELDGVLAELHSLDGVLDLLKDDATSFPAALAKRTPPLLKHCTSITSQIEGYMHVCNGLGLSKREKKFRWLAIRGDVERLRSTLEGYKSILALVTDLVGMYVSWRLWWAPVASGLLKFVQLLTPWPGTQIQVAQRKRKPVWKQ